MIRHTPPPSILRTGYEYKSTVIHGAASVHQGDVHPYLIAGPREKSLKQIHNGKHRIYFAYNALQDDNAMKASLTRSHCLKCSTAATAWKQPIATLAHRSSMTRSMLLGSRLFVAFYGSKASQELENRRL